MSISQSKATCFKYNRPTPQFTWICLPIDKREQIQSTHRFLSFDTKVRVFVFLLCDNVAECSVIIRVFRYEGYFVDRMLIKCQLKCTKIMHHNFL